MDKKVQSSTAANKTQATNTEAQSSSIAANETQATNTEAQSSSTAANETQATNTEAQSLSTAANEKQVTKTKDQSLSTAANETQVTNTKAQSLSTAANETQATNTKDQSSSITTSLHRPLSKMNESHSVSTLNKNILFIGNPGVGKSTLLNSTMFKENHSIDSTIFKSGINFGSGLTQKFEIKTCGGISYMDTPGLQDIDTRKQAACEITKALTYGGNYQIVFVITLESGRIRPADVVCMEMVLESGGSQISYYGVVINKLSKDVYQALALKETDRYKIISQIKLNNKSKLESKTPRIPYPLLIGMSQDLDDKDDVFLNIPELNDFLDNVLPCVYINPKHVKPIPDDDTFEKLSEQMESEIKQLKINKEKMEEKIEHDREEHKEMVQKLILEEDEKHRIEMAKLEEEAKQKRNLIEEKQKFLEEQQKHMLKMQEIEQKNDVKSQEQVLLQIQVETLKKEQQNLADKMERMEVEHSAKIKSLKENVIIKFFNKLSSSPKSFFNKCASWMKSSNS